MSTSGGSSGGGASTVVQVKKALTAGQIATLNASPVQIVAAPGAGKVIQIVTFQYKIMWVTTGYTSTAGRISVGPHDQVVNDFSPWETNPPGAAAARLASSNGDSPSGGSWMEINQNGIDQTPPEYMTNQALVVGNPGDEFLGGDATVTLYLAYQVITL